MNKHRLNTLFVVLALLSLLPYGVWALSNTASQQFVDKADAPLHNAVINIGPVNLRHKYESMSGPFVYEVFYIGDIISRHDTTVPESHVKYIDDAYPSSKITVKILQENLQYQTAHEHHPNLHLQQSNSLPRKLYWFKGYQIQTIDEHNRILPTNEFLCHASLRLFVHKHKQLFPAGDVMCGNPGTISNSIGPRIIYANQGQDAAMFPKGFGIPVASDEPIWLNLGTLNRSSAKERHIKFRCTLFFVKDSELHDSMQALTARNLWMMVVLKKRKGDPLRTLKQGCGVCTEQSFGEDAPTDAHHLYVKKTSSGYLYSEKWALPPGMHTYHTKISNGICPDFALSGPIHAAMFHEHPYCTSFSLLEYRKKQKNAVFQIHCKTKDSPVEVTQLDTVISSKGIPLHSDAQYVQELVCNNTSGKTVDAMSGCVILCSDPTFRKPAWARVHKSRQ